MPAKPSTAPPRDAPKPAHRLSPSASTQEAGRATSSEKKGPKSMYDFPDSPDDEAIGKPSSYMALSSSTRSPRRGVVDSSENRGAGGEGGKEGDVESSEDVAPSEINMADSGISKDNEAQGYERFVSEGNSRKAAEPDEGSNISQTSADSTDRLMVDESASMESSEVSSQSGNRRGSKSSQNESSPHCSSEYSSSNRQGHRSRSPRSYPPSSSEHGPGAGMGFPRGEGEAESREQEPQPLLSSQYETLSDDEQP